MSVAEIADATALHRDDAKRAKQRQATEPFQWSGTASELRDLKAIMAAAGIQVQQGGRFHHFTGATTKQHAMAQLVQSSLRTSPKTEIISIALGDGPNDLDMIEAADFGVIMPNPNGVSIESAIPTVRQAAMPGPKGWVMAMKAIMRELGFKPPQV